ncbi:MAG: hypothetical protein JST19_04890, partial [Bacteroidetes bacterium]|nr:hypothetical protein [Bacteroidota bacterium]
MRRIIFIIAALVPFGNAFAQQIDLRAALTGNTLITLPSTHVKPMQDGDRKGITTDDNLWFKKLGFTYGTIEVDIRGRNEFLHSFPGIAFHAADTSKNYDVVYFRPFNFRHA